MPQSIPYQGYKQMNEKYSQLRPQQWLELIRFGIVLRSIAVQLNLLNLLNPPFLHFLQGVPQKASQKMTFLAL